MFLLFSYHSRVEWSRPSGPHTENIDPLVLLQKMFVSLYSRGKMGRFQRKYNLEKNPNSVSLSFSAE